MRIRIPDFDKPHRCPVRSGSGMNWPREDEEDVCKTGMAFSIITHDYPKLSGPRILEYTSGEWSIRLFAKRWANITLRPNYEGFSMTRSIRVPGYDAFLPCKCTDCGAYTVPWVLTAPLRGYENIKYQISTKIK